MILFRQWTPEEYRNVLKSHYWNLAMSLMRLHPWNFFLKNYEKSILSAVKAVLSSDEAGALTYQLTKLDGIERHFKGRFHEFFVDRRRFPPLSEAKGEVPLATLKIRQGGRCMRVIVEISDGALYSISFRPGQFKEKEPFEILEVLRGGKPSKTAQALDRWAHGRNQDDAEPTENTGQTEQTQSTDLSPSESKTIFIMNDAASFGN